jgi:hypothetical protein
MVSIFLSDSENSLISFSEKDNKEELINWKIPNLLFPLIVVAVSLIAYGIFIPADKKNWSDFFNLLLNGSIPMVAFNRMSSIISYFSKIEFSDAKKLGISLKNLRMKILFYIIFLILAIIFLYSYQVINKPFDLSCLTLLQFILSGLLFWFSADVTKVAFLLQETLLNNTYELSFRKAQQLITKIPQDNEITFE